MDDLSTLSEEAVQEYISHEIMNPFDLAREPLLRARLLFLNAREHILVLTIHHIAFDGWSGGVLFQELTTLYKAFQANQPSPLPDLAIQYADYALWQRDRLTGDVLEKQLTYWRKQLSHAPAHIPFPTDRPRPALPNFHGTFQVFSLPASLVSSLSQLGQRRDTTLFMTLLAAFQVLLARYIGQDDSIMGSLIANRTKPEVEKLVGFFVNTLVLRADLSGNPSFSEVLRRVREICLDAYEHQDLPFEKLVEEIQPERTLSNQPLFQILFQLENTLGEALQLQEVTVTPLIYKGQVARWELACFVREEQDGLRVTLEYSTELFDASTIARLFEHFQVLLEHISRDPECNIWEYPLQRASAIQQLLYDWNNTQADYERDKCIQDLFEDQVRRTPSAIAVDCDGRQLTYEELNQQTNQIAHFLRERGVTQGVPVAICMERTLELIPALLAVLKASGFYVPMEPSFPVARLQWILSSLRVPILLTQTSLLETIQQITDVPALQTIACLDTAVSSPFADDQKIWLRQQFLNYPVENLARVSDPGDLAYIIFTSGSTGTSLGVMIQHQPVVNLIEWVNRTCEIGPTDRVLFVTSICFDLSVYDIFGLLAAGGSIRVVSNGDLHDPEKLMQILCQEPATFWDSAPAFLQQLMPFFSHEEYKQSIKESKWCLVFLSGDWIPLALPGQISTFSPRTKLISLGGATEATVWSNYFRVEEVSPHWSSIPYGQPLQNVCYYVLNRYLSPCPINIAGDLYIGGECLTAGYIDEPVLTAQKFIPDPFSSRPGTRLYRIGDRARFWSNGIIEFLGREDSQVKIRGFRIEPGEIEAVLETHEAVQKALVTVIPGENRHEKRLVAYVVLNAGSTVQMPTLRKFLHLQLPEYMIPHFLLPLSAIPLTSNGKIDWRTLPAPNHAQLELPSTYVAPSWSNEKILAEVWQEVLHVEKVGIHDNFFEVGGDSIQCIQVIARAGEAGIKITSLQMFQFQTIAELATVVERVQPEEVEPEILAGMVPLTPIQQWFFERDFVNPHHFNHAYLFKLNQPLEPALLAQSIGHLLAHHDALRLRFTRSAERWIQTYSPGHEPVPFEHRDLSIYTEQDAMQHIQEISNALQASLDITNGPLMRVALFGLVQDSLGYLLIIIHHLVVDAVSWQALLEDFERIYTQFAYGKTLRLSPKTTSFGQWVEQLSRYTLTETVQQERAYWLALARQELTRLLQDSLPGENLVATRATLAENLDEQETSCLLQIVSKAYAAHIDEVILSALGRNFGQWAGGPSVLFHVERHGREMLFDNVDLSRTTGWFTNLLPVVLSGASTIPFADTVHQVKQQLRESPQWGLALAYFSSAGRPRRQKSNCPLLSRRILYSII